MKILQIITVSYLIKISSIQVIFVFLYLLFDNRDKNCMYMDMFSEKTHISSTGTIAVHM